VCEGLAPEPFERLALDIAAWQRIDNPILNSLSPREVSQWQQIPAVPVALYRWLNVSSIKTDEECVCFETSGTTGLQPGKHRLRNTRLYDFNAVEWARRHVAGDFSEVISLVEQKAHSSLAHMIALFPSLRPSTSQTWWVESGVLRLEALLEHLENLNAPVFMATTASALAELLETGAPALSPGSTVMITGGFKGRKTRFDEVSLYTETTAQLRPKHLLTEYGMCELSSQLWGVPGEPYRAAPWLRVLAVDPITAEVLEHGTVGQLRFYDLCNLDSSLGIETLDQGIVHEDGRISLLGRLPGATLRGCSLQIEPSWEGR
jgi:hypothetical protein